VETKTELSSPIKRGPGREKGREIAFKRGPKRKSLVIRKESEKKRDTRSPKHPRKRYAENREKGRAEEDRTAACLKLTVS